MAVDLIDNLIPPGPGSRRLCPEEKQGEASLLKRYLYYWTSLSPHPVRPATTLVRCRRESIRC
jgi:hypothetical protein